MQYRVIPRAFEVADARLELRAAESAYALRPVGLTNGSGAAVFGPGTALPLAFPSVRLVVNAGRENEIIGHGKRLSA